TDQTSESGCIHGMDLAAACGLCCEELTVGKNKVNLLGKNLHIIGARSIDPPEYGIVVEQGVHVYPAEEVRQRGVDGVLAQVLPALAGKRVHISFDVDSLDPAEFSATGYNIPAGLSLADVKAILAAVLQTGSVCSFECVEYNPTLDADGRDLATLLELFRLMDRELSYKSAGNAAY
ncbi:MAG: arginase family protein, partial [Oscillospiraceae bacterium]